MNDNIIKYNIINPNPLNIFEQYCSIFLELCKHYCSTCSIIHNSVYNKERTVLANILSTITSQTQSLLYIGHKKLFQIHKLSCTHALFHSSVIIVTYYNIRQETMETSFTPTPARNPPTKNNFYNTIRQIHRKIHYQPPKIHGKQLSATISKTQIPLQALSR